MLASVSYSEITMKGGNRRMFESLLLRNISAALSGLGDFTAEKMGGRVLFRCGSEAEEGEVRDALLRTFGVDLVSFPEETPADIGAMEAAVRPHAKKLAGKKIRVEARRTDKSFPLTSQQVNERLGRILVEAGCGVDLDNPEMTVFVEILRGRALIYTERFRGPGGLPVGSSGRVLSLLSGGIDSPVATWLMMKRGCEADLLHVHTLRENRGVLESKMARLAASLRAYSPRKLSLIAVPYTEFYKRSISLDPRNELVLFRRFLFRLANRLAAERNCKAVVTGDSVGQVASQTLDNIFASDEASEIPVFRPLVGFNKQEIVDLAVRIGTYGASIEKYKDCCSLVAHKSPSTRVPLAVAKKLETEAGIDGIVERSLAQAEVFEL